MAYLDSNNDLDEIYERLDSYYVCMVLIVGCSALLIVICWFGKLSIGKSRKLTYRSLVYHDD